MDRNAINAPNGENNRPPQLLRNLNHEGGNPNYQGQSSGQNSSSSLEEMMKALTSNTMQFQKDTQSRIKNLEMQMTQLATAVSRLEAQSGWKLPSQPEINPRNVSAMTLRSGKELESPKIPAETQKTDGEEEAVEQSNTGAPVSKQSSSVKTSKSAEVKNEFCEKFPIHFVPFPSRLARAAKEELKKSEEILKINKEMNYASLANVKLLKYSILEDKRKHIEEVSVLDEVQTPSQALPINFPKLKTIKRKKLNGGTNIVVSNVSSQRPLPKPPW